MAPPQDACVRLCWARLGSDIPFLAAPLAYAPRLGTCLPCVRLGASDCNRDAGYFGRDFSYLLGFVIALCVYLIFGGWISLHYALTGYWRAIGAFCIRDVLA